MSLPWLVSTAHGLALCSFTTWPVSEFLWSFTKEASYNFTPRLYKHSFLMINLLVIQHVYNKHIEFVVRWFLVIVLSVPGDTHYSFTHIPKDHWTGMVLPSFKEGLWKIWAKSTIKSNHDKRKPCAKKIYMYVYHCVIAPVILKQSWIIRVNWTTIIFNKGWIICIILVISRIFCILLCHYAMQLNFHSKVCFIQWAYSGAMVTNCR